MTTRPALEERVGKLYAEEISGALIEGITSVAKGCTCLSIPNKPCSCAAHINRVAESMRDCVETIVAYGVYTNALVSISELRTSMMDIHYKAEQFSIPTMNAALTKLTSHVRSWSDRTHTQVIENALFSMRNPDKPAVKRLKRSHPFIK